MTRKKRRLALIAGGMAVIAAAAALALSALSDSLVFYIEPRDIEARLASGDIVPGQTIRIGGLIETGSVVRKGVDAHFRVTDLTASIDVAYSGLLPDLFREGQGVVAEGVMGDDSVFHASNVLAKHDETYMPREVADALKKSGKWDPAAAAAPAHPGESSGAGNQPQG